LALCARAGGHPLFYKQLTRQTEGFTAWDELPAQAELHSVAPLLWHHIQRSGAPIPLETEKTLRGLHFRHRALCRIHTQVLKEINKLFESAGIQTLLLKGLALGYQYYPDPALRPVGDIDFLLKQTDVLPTLELLTDAGFRTDSPPEPGARLPKELTADSPLRDGIRVHIELHHHDPQGRSPVDLSPDNEFEGFNEPPHTVVIEGNNVYVPSPTDTLCYLSRHLTRHLFSATESRPLPLKWCADFISLVEKEAESIDWPYLHKYHPDLLKRLEIFYSLTPMPQYLEMTLPLQQTSPPNGLNQYLTGWPHEAFSDRRRTGFLRLLTRTFTRPSDWWVRLYYGIGERSVFWYGHIVYRLLLLRRMFWMLIYRLKNKTPEF